MNRRLLLALAVAFCARAELALRDGDRVLFIGDSITQAGAYVEYVEAALMARFPSQRFDVIKLGLSSETVSGLTEPDHPLPRPDAHERLDRALARTRPTVVVACYGMNDGIYHPFSEERFAAYRAGVLKLLEKVRAANARAVLLTPPPFEPGRSRGRLTDQPPFGYKTPYKDYDSVLERYGRWLMTLDGVQVIDLHAPLKARGEFTRDGVHPGDEGHRAMAEAILNALGAPDALPALDRKPEVLALVRERWKVLGPAWLIEAGHRRAPSPKIPFAEAQRQAAALEAKARAAATSAPSR